MTLYFEVVEEGEAAAAIVPGTIVLERRILDAKAVGPVARLHVDDGRSEIAQQLADVRTGGIAAEFEDLEIPERLRDRGHVVPSLARVPSPLAAGGLRRPSAAATRATRPSPRRRPAPRVALAGSWRSGGRSPSITAKLPQNRACDPPTRLEEPARLELRIAGDIGHRGDRIAEHLAAVTLGQEFALGEAGEERRAPAPRWHRPRPGRPWSDPRSSSRLRRARRARHRARASRP